MLPTKSARCPPVRHSAYAPFSPWPPAPARQRGHLHVMKTLPAPLMEDGVPASEKLVYMWITDHPGEHSARSLTAALGVRVKSALTELIEKGLVVEEKPPGGKTPGQYRAAPSKRD